MERIGTVRYEIDDAAFKLALQEKNYNAHLTQSVKFDKAQLEVSDDEDSDVFFTPVGSVSEFISEFPGTDDNEQITTNLDGEPPEQNFKELSVKDLGVENYNRMITLHRPSLENRVIGLSYRQMPTEVNSLDHPSQLPENDDIEQITTNLDRDGDIGAAGTSIPQGQNSKEFSVEDLEIEKYNRMITLHRPVLENRVIGLSYRQMPAEGDRLDRPSKRVHFEDEFNKEKTARHENKLWRRTRDFFHSLPAILRNENLQFLMTSITEITFCVVVDGHVINHDKVKVEYLPQYMRKAIAARLPTYKKMVILILEEQDLPPPGAVEVTTQVLSQWLRLCETKDFLFFVELAKLDRKKLGVNFPSKSVGDRGKDSGPEQSKSS